MPEWSDRYEALGIPYPDPDTVCPGPCEGVGRVPVSAPYPIKCGGLTIRRFPPETLEEEAMEKELERRWREAEKKKPTDDGYHFVICPVCEGTGKRQTEKELQ